MLQRGTFNTSSAVQEMSRQTHTEIAKGTFNLFPKANAPSGNRGQRTFALGTFQSGDKKLGRQHYDVRYNLHVCKELITMWGRNAYTTDSNKGGEPIVISDSGAVYDVYCHIDITTPRDNFLWHHIEGPHVVVDGYTKRGDTYPKKCKKGNVFALSPDEVYMLYVWERDHNKDRPNNTARTWPQWLLKKILCCIV
jgi:hypothetical protein